MGTDETQHLCPGIGRGIAELGSAAIEEAVRRPWIDHDRMLDAAAVERLIEGLDLLDWDALVGPAKQPERRST